MVAIGCCDFCVLEPTIMAHSIRNGCHSSAVFCPDCWKKRRKQYRDWEHFEMDDVDKEGDIYV